MGALAGLIAHGGTAGLIAEIGIAVLAGVAFGSIWWRERRRRMARAQRLTTKPP
jgi:hypothetical protein